jgi:hypothetical protein
MVFVIFVIIVGTSALSLGVYAFMSAKVRRSTENAVARSGLDATQLGLLQETQSGFAFHVFVSIFFSKDLNYRRDLPEVTVRRGPFSFVAGNRAGGWLEINSEGIHFKARRWPLSVGVWGHLTISWSDISEVKVQDPYDGDPNLGGNLVFVIPKFDIGFLSFDFVGSQVATRLNLQRVGAPLT